MKAFIIDDESDSIYALELIVKEYVRDLEIVGKYTNAFDALAELDQLKPEIIFLDINMPQMDGFEFVKKINTQKLHIVFISAYDEYAIKGFKFDAFDYLLKPINIDELLGTIHRIKSGKSPDMGSIQELKNTLSKRKLEDEKITITTPEGLNILKISEIVYFTSFKKFSKVITTKNEEIFNSKSLKEIEDIVGGSFFRVHNSYLINLQYIKMIEKSDKWEIVMDNGDKIPTARGRKKELNSIISRIISH